MLHFDVLGAESQTGIPRRLLKLFGGFRKSCCTLKFWQAWTLRWVVLISPHNCGSAVLNPQLCFILPSLLALLSQMSGPEGAENELKPFSLNGWMASGTVSPLGYEQKWDPGWLCMWGKAIWWLFSDAWNERSAGDFNTPKEASLYRHNISDAGQPQQWGQRLSGP